MSWVLVKQEAAGMGGTQLMAGGGGGAQVYLTPDRPVTPEEAGMAAVDRYLSGRRAVLPDRAPSRRVYSPEQRQSMGGTASRFARTAGKYGALAAAIGGGLKNLYDQTASGEPLSATGLGTSALAGYQFAKPLATRAGAQAGARVGVRGVQREARDARAAQRTGSPASADFSMPQGTDMSMFDMAPPTQYDSTQTSPLAQAGLANINPSMMSGDSRAYGGYGAPSMSMGDFRQVMPSFSPTQPPAAPTPTPPTPAEGGMSQRLSSALPNTNPMEDAMEQMKEQQKEAQEKKEEMNKEQLESLQRNLRNPEV